MINYKIIVKYGLLILEMFMAKVGDSYMSIIRENPFAKIAVLIILAGIVLRTLTLFEEKPAFEPDEVA